MVPPLLGQILGKKPPAKRGIKSTTQGVWPPGPPHRETKGGLKKIEGNPRGTIHAETKLRKFPKPSKKPIMGKI